VWLSKSETSHNASIANGSGIVISFLTKGNFSKRELPFLQNLKVKLITTSLDISILRVKAVFDITGQNPVLQLTNLSTEINPANLKWAFELYSPSNTAIHIGDFNAPDVDGNFAAPFTVPGDWPRPFGQIEWGQDPYTLVIRVKDLAGKIFEDQITQVIARPNGNSAQSKNMFGVASLFLRVLCDKARLFFEDKTDRVYQNLAPSTIVSSVLRLNYPEDDYDNTPEPIEVSDFSTAMLPIFFSAEGYEAVLTSSLEYSFDNDSYVRIKYRSKNVFPVLCNVDLCPLVCEVQRYADKIQAGDVPDLAEAHRTLTVINGKLILALLGKQEPLCGIDVPALIEEIKTLGGFACNCYSNGNGINGGAASVIDNYVWDVINTGGDVDGVVEKVGNTIQIKLFDTSYVFQMCVGAPTNAFTIEPSLAGHTKTYCLNVDLGLLGNDLLTKIKDTPALVNLFNSIVTLQNNGAFKLVVDGKCIVPTNKTYNYIITIPGVPGSGSLFSVVDYITANKTYQLSFALNQDTVAAFEGVLNGLGIGVFVVSYNAGVVTITSDANPFVISESRYNGNLYANIAKETNSTVEFTANEVVQGIINYLCALNAATLKMKMEQTLNLCVLVEGQKKQFEFDSGSDIDVELLIRALADSQCSIITYVLGLTGFGCDQMKNIFKPQPSLPFDKNGVLYGQKNDQCAPVSLDELIDAVLERIAEDDDKRVTFCELVSSCGTPTCRAINNYDLTVVVPGGEFDPNQFDNQEFDTN
jgi:hypothetical protein